MKQFVKFLGPLMLCGCSALHHSPPPGAPVALSQDFWRDEADSFSPSDRTMIAAAKDHLAKSGRRPRGASRDAYYRVRYSADGCEVFALYVAGYDGNRPRLEPRLHNAVLLRNDGSLRKILAGPECWP
jgi:hypothetical protein